MKRYAMRQMPHQKPLFIEAVLLSFRAARAAAKPGFEPKFTRY
jgi:hypothetical protein